MSLSPESSRCSSPCDSSCSSSSGESDEGKTLPVVGLVENWEEDMLNRDMRRGGDGYYTVANHQTSIQRTIKWLLLSAEGECEEGMMVYGGLLYGLNPDLKYKRDEAAWWVKRVEEERLVEKVGSFDSDGSRARRHLTRLLLSGSLSKNQDSVLYRSFFRSSMREVHLLPLISKYLIEEGTKEKGEEKREGARHTVSSLFHISSIAFSPSSSLTDLSIEMGCDNQFLCFLPLLFSLLPNLKNLTIYGQNDNKTTPDLSLLQQVDTSKLEYLLFHRCSFNSLSPLSLCDLSSLHTLVINDCCQVNGLHPLNGISSDITRSLKLLIVYGCDLKDLSPLSDCDLSSVANLELLNNLSLSDLSALRGSDLSSLEFLHIGLSNISDLSPLCECKGLAPEAFHLIESPIEDLSPLSLLDLSRMNGSIYLSSTNVSDLSPLENISYDGVEVYITNTPACEKMEEEGLESPQTIGKVKVIWGL